MIVLEKDVNSGGSAASSAAGWAGWAMSGMTNITAKIYKGKGVTAAGATSSNGNVDIDNFCYRLLTGNGIFSSYICSMEEHFNSINCVCLNSG